MKKCYPHSKEGNISTQIGSQILKALFCDFWGKLCNLRQQCHNCMHAFHIDLHPPANVQLKIPTVDVKDLLRLSVMHILKVHVHLEKEALVLGVGVRGGCLLFSLCLFWDCM